LFPLHISSCHSAPLAHLNLSQPHFPHNPTSRLQSNISIPPPHNLLPIDNLLHGPRHLLLRLLGPPRVARGVFVARPGVARRLVDVGAGLLGRCERLELGLRLKWDLGLRLRQGLSLRLGSCGDIDFGLRRSGSGQQRVGDGCGCGGGGFGGADGGGGCCGLYQPWAFPELKSPLLYVANAKLSSTSLESRTHLWQGLVYLLRMLR